jgi:hypothetical protein
MGEPVKIEGVAEGLVVRHGDVLVLKVEDMDSEEVEALAIDVKAKLPDGCRVIVLGGDLAMGVIRS